MHKIAQKKQETLKVVILNGGFSQQLTSDIIVDTLSTKMNKKQTDAKAGAGGDAKRLGSHTHLIRGRHGKAGMGTPAGRRIIITSVIIPMSRLFTPRALSLNLRLDRGKYVLSIGGER